MISRFPPRARARLSAQPLILHLPLRPERLALVPLVRLSRVAIIVLGGGLTAPGRRATKWASDKAPIG